MNWNNNEKQDTTTYKVLVNHEEQYSIWPDDKEIPPAWQSAGKTGAKEECLVYIREVWTDMRPLSLRKKMEELARNPPSPRSSLEPDLRPEKSLVERLSGGDHPVEVGLRRERNAKAFKDAIHRNFVHIKFTETNGGTELGFRVDQDASDLSNADLESEKGVVHLEGDLTLDYVKARCIVDVDLSTLQGKGHLVRSRPESNIAVINVIS